VNGRMDGHALRRAGLATAVVVLAIAPLVLGSFAVSLLNDIGIGALVALGLVLLTGIGGATSFGQAAFVGVAAYATAWLTTAHGASPWLGLVFALALTGLAALLIGLLTLRLGGHYLPLSTIAWGISIPLLFGNLEALGSHSGLSGIPPLQIGPWRLLEPRSIYYLIWACVGFACLFSRNLLHSRAGRAIRGLRGGATLLASVGADAFRVRLVLFVTAALFAGVAGWLYAHLNRFVAPTPFDVRASIEYLLMVVAGGLGQIAGAIVGSGLVLLLKNSLQDVLPLLSLQGARLEAVAFSIIFILLLHHARAGLTGFVARWGRQHFPERLEPARDEAAPPLPKRPMPAGGSELLKVTGAVKRFGGLVAVDDVSFEVRAGEIVGLIGPNGAGKSTMFNLLTGTMRMTSGQVTFAGRDITGMAQQKIARLGIARTFQHVKLRPRMNLLDNVALGAHARGRAGVLRAGLCLERAEERQIAAEARRQLERIGLGGRGHELAGSLPLGTQRILEIGRALAADPVLLVLDEPAAGLRRAEKQALAAMLRRLRGDGVTILIVEHDMDFVMKLVDRLIVMDFGSKLVEGTPAAVRADSRVQAAYLGGSGQPMPARSGAGA
jgi:branched-chain amino acid transport system permease protein